jgi:hypothetical protein
LRKVSFCLIVVVLQLLFMDAVLQVFYRVSNGDWLVRRIAIPIFEEDEYRVYRVKPNLNYEFKTNEFSVKYYTDNFGFRAANSDVVTQIEKPEGVYRVMFLGPSFAFGSANNYEDAYATLIGQGLVKKGMEVEFINVGTPSQPPRLYLCWLARLGYKFEPDLLVQTVYGFPVLFEERCDTHTQLVIKDGSLYTEDPTVLLRLQAAAKQSAVVFYGWHLYRAVAPAVEEHAGVGLGLELYNDATIWLESVSDEGIVKSMSEYLEFVHLAIGDDAKVAFLYVPFSYIAHPDYVVRFSGSKTQPRELLTDFSKRVRKLLGQRGWLYIDPTDALVEAGKSDKMYNYLDVHFTPAGNRVTAEVAIPELQRLIDAPPLVKK